MAYPVYSIDGNAFIALQGEVSKPQLHSQIIQRPNVADIDVRFFAEKGKPFTLVSISSHTTLSACYTAYDTYLAMIGAGTVVLVKNDVTFTDNVVVLDVQLSLIKKIGTAAGNIGVSDNFIMSCVFSLVMETT